WAGRVRRGDPVGRPDLLGCPGPDLVRGQQELADPGEDRPQHDDGRLLDVVIDLRDWHGHLSLTCVPAMPLAGLGACAREFILPWRPVHRSSGPRFVRITCGIPRPDGGRRGRRWAPLPREGRLSIPRAELLPKPPRIARAWARGGRPARGRCGC